MLVGKKVATWLCSSQDLSSPLKYASRGKSGFVAMQLSRPPLSLGIIMLVGKKGAGCLHSYTVVKTSHPPWNMLVEKKSGYVAIQRKLRVCIAA